MPLIALSLKSAAGSEKKKQQQKTVHSPHHDATTAVALCNRFAARLLHWEEWQDKFNTSSLSHNHGGRNAEVYNQKLFM